MLTADWIVIAAIIVFALLGVLLGFGNGLKFFTSGIFGIIISIFVCYMILGFVLDMSAVQKLLEKFNDYLYSSGSVGTFFADIGIGKIIAAVILFLLVQLIRILVVKLLAAIVEINNAFFKVLNSVLGVVFFLVVLLAIILIVFQVYAWIGGATYTNFLAKLDGSLLELDKLCENNPLISIFS